MKIGYLMERLREVRSTLFDPQAVFDELSRVESMVSEEVFGLGPVRLLFDKDDKTELLAGPPCDGLYLHYLCAPLDLMAQEYDSASTEMAVFTGLDWRARVQDRARRHMVNMSTDGGSWPFKTGDGVTIEGCSQAYNNRTAVVRIVDGNTLTFYDNVFQYGELGSEPNQNTHGWNERTAVFSRTVPDLDFVYEKDNRIWGGCMRITFAARWPSTGMYSAGLATDAFDVGVGSDGNFTGIAGYASYVLAF